MSHAVSKREDNSLANKRKQAQTIINILNNNNIPTHASDCEKYTKI